MLHEIYGSDAQGQRRHSPPICLGTKKQRVMGNPVERLVSTSYVERVNLGTRMRSRRFTSLTNGFSKKMENLAHAVALHLFTASYCQPHMTLTKKAGGIHTSPAMAAGLTDHVWTIEAMLGMMDGAVKVG